MEVDIAADAGDERAHAARMASKAEERLTGSPPRQAWKYAWGGTSQASLLPLLTRAPAAHATRRLC